DALAAGHPVGVVPRRLRGHGPALARYGRPAVHRRSRAVPAGRPQCSVLGGHDVRRRERDLQTHGRGRPDDVSDLAGVAGDLAATQAQRRQRRTPGRSVSHATPVTEGTSRMFSATRRPAADTLVEALVEGALRWPYAVTF